jgi:hypothetical protein
MTQTPPGDLQERIRRLEEEAEREGVTEHLQAARELARDRLPAEQIDFMMRGLFTREAIADLEAEAAWHASRSARQSV